MKEALEEWWHWLEGTKEPLLPSTDHKNLEYLRIAKRLDSRQACWSLFFTRFNSVLYYRPGSHNIKADALSRQSRQFQQEGDSAESPVTILPPSLL